MDNEKVVKHIKKKILSHDIIFTLLSWVIIFIALVIPTYNILLSKEQDSIQYSKNIANTYLNNYFSNLFDIASQISSRTKARDLLLQWNSNGDSEKYVITSKLRKILNDSAKSDSDIIYIARYDSNNKLIAEYGKKEPIIKQYKNKSSKQIKISRPIIVENNKYFIVESPILDEKKSKIGTDLIVFDANDVQQNLSKLTKTSYSSEVYLGYEENNSIRFLDINNLLTEHSNILNDLLKKHNKAFSPLEIYNKDQKIYACIINLAGLDWPIVLVSETDKIRTYIQKNLLYIIGIFIFIMAILMPILWLLVLKPITNKIILYVKTLEQQNKEKTQKLEKINQLLVESTKKDSLTGLFNRTAFLEYFKNYENLASRKGEKIAILFLDLDGFKDVNDNFGHDTGDKLLQYIAKSFTGHIRASDIVARVGGDEFAVLLYNVKSREDIVKISQKIISHIDNISIFEEHLIKLGISIGAAIYPEDANNCNDLINAADKAMYIAKSKGGNSIWFFGDLDI